MSDEIEIFGGDAARLLGTPSLANCPTAASVAAIVRAGAEEAEAGRWVILGGLPNALFVDDPAFAAALDAAAPRHPVCLWTADFFGAVVNGVAAADRAIGTRLHEGVEVKRVRSVLPRWTLETWKDRLELLAADLASRGIRRVVDLDEDAAEGWRALDDENLLALERVDVVCAERNLRRALRDGARSDGRVFRTGVLFDFDLENFSRDRRVEDLRMAKAAGLRPRVVARTPSSRAESALCLRAC